MHDRLLPSSLPEEQASDKRLPLDLGPANGPAWDVMEQVYLFGIASQRTSWLATRQALVAENVANADTPGYKAKDLTSFAEVLETTRLNLASSNNTHMASLSRASDGQDVVSETPWDVTHSGNSVSLEQEMLKAGEISRAYSLDTSVVKAFHRLLVMSVKG